MQSHVRLSAYLISTAILAGLAACSDSSGGGTGIAIAGNPPTGINVIAGSPAVD